MFGDGEGTVQRILIAIPAWNESDTLPAVIAELGEAVPDADVLVVDDGSSDETFSVAGECGASALQLPFNVGVGGAMRTAFLFANRAGYDAVVQVDADGQHDPAFVLSLLAGLADADVVVGSRFAGAGEYKVRGPRRWAMTVLARVLTRVCESPLTDATSGFRASGPRAVALFAQHYPAEYLGDTLDSLILASRAGLTVRETPVSMRARQGGTPSQNPLRSSVYLGRSMLALFVALTRRPVTSGQEP